MSVHPDPVFRAVVGAYPPERHAELESLWYAMGMKRVPIREAAKVFDRIVQCRDAACGNRACRNSGCQGGDE